MKRQSEESIMESLSIMKNICLLLDMQFDKMSIRFRTLKFVFDVSCLDSIC